MLAGVLDRIGLPGRRRSQYLHRVNVERGPRPPAVANDDAVPSLRQRRPHSYHGGGVQQQPREGGGGGDALRASKRKLAAKFWSSCGSSRATVAAELPAAVRKRAASTTAAATNGGFPNLSHTWRFKRLRYALRGACCLAVCRSPFPPTPLSHRIAFDRL